MKTYSFHSPLTGANIDRNACVIRNVSLITGGIEAEGHGLFCDSTTLSQVLASAQAAGQVPVKLDHGSGIEALCGYIENFHRVGNKILGDWHLLETHAETPRLLERAEKMPALFGLSVAFKGQGVAVAGGKKAARCEELKAVDCVASPAANPDGLFSVPHTFDNRPRNAQGMFTGGSGGIDPQSMAAAYGGAAQKSQGALARISAALRTRRPVQPAVNPLDDQPQLSSRGRTIDFMAVWKDSKTIKPGDSISPKLDGIYAKATKDGLFTKNGKEIMSQHHVNQALEQHFQKNPHAKLEGELYVHGMPFEDIVSASRTGNAKLQFHIHPGQETPDAPLDGCVKQIASVPVDSEAEARAVHVEHLNQGYEGSVINQGAKDFKKKPLHDAEYEITGGSVGMKHGILHLKGPKGSFRVQAPRAIAENAPVGQQATVSYTRQTNSGLPHAPIFKSVREFSTMSTPSPRRVRIYRKKADLGQRSLYGLSPSLGGAEESASSPAAGNFSAAEAIAYRFSTPEDQVQDPRARESELDFLRMCQEDLTQRNLLRVKSGQTPLTLQQVVAERKKSIARLTGVSFALPNDQNQPGDQPSPFRDAAVGGLEGAAGYFVTDRIANSLAPAGSGILRKAGVAGAVGALGTVAAGSLLNQIAKRKQQGQAAPVDPSQPRVGGSYPLSGFSRNEKLIYLAAKLENSIGGAPLTGRTSHDRLTKEVYNSDANNRDKHIAEAGAAGAAAGMLSHAGALSRVGTLGRAGIGAGLAGASVLGIRAITGRHRDIYGDRTRSGKTIEKLPAVIGGGIAGKLAIDALRKKYKFSAKDDESRRLRDDAIGAGAVAAGSGIGYAGYHIGKAAQEHERLAKAAADTAEPVAAGVQKIAGIAAKFKKTLGRKLFSITSEAAAEAVQLASHDSRNQIRF